MQQAAAPGERRGHAGVPPPIAKPLAHAEYVASGHATGILPRKQRPARSGVKRRAGDDPPVQPAAPAAGEPARVHAASAESRADAWPPWHRQSPAGHPSTSFGGVAWRGEPFEDGARSSRGAAQRSGHNSAEPLWRRLLCRRPGARGRSWRPNRSAIGLRRMTFPQWLATRNSAAIRSPQTGRSGAAGMAIHAHVQLCGPREIAAVAPGTSEWFGAEPPAADRGCRRPGCMRTSSGTTMDPVPYTE
mmetsp:Transcript_100917/g.284710  ORF Transcript_100917/g.284710 Transcript_100917/m.284710 type:complete len:246 (+) Transcript_100917:1859-2596(+)